MQSRSYCPPHNMADDVRKTSLEEATYYHRSEPCLRSCSDLCTARVDAKMPLLNISLVPVRWERDISGLPRGKISNRYCAEIVHWEKAPTQVRGIPEDRLIETPTYHHSWAQDDLLYSSLKIIAATACRLLRGIILVMPRNRRLNR